MDEGVFRAVVYEKHNLRLIFTKDALHSITVGRMPLVWSELQKYPG
jgi:hypothetical protein